LLVIYDWRHLLLVPYQSLQKCYSKKKTQIKKWLSLKSIGLGESDIDYDGGNVVRLKLICIGLGKSDLDYDGGNVVCLKLICISSKVIGQLHKDEHKIYFKKGHNF
jgi:hypothetical protein